MGINNSFQIARVFNKRFCLSFIYPSNESYSVCIIWLMHGLLNIFIFEFLIAKFIAREKYLPLQN